jgi:branched-chain amino acid transport system permease protein
VPIPALLAEAFGSPQLPVIFQYLINGLTIGMLYALIALGYTMVYGIIELINFAHGDLFMLGCFFALTILSTMGLSGSAVAGASTAMLVVGVVLMFLLTPLFAAAVNWSVDRVIYKPLRDAPKLTALVSAIGVSFIFMNIGQFWNALIKEEGRPVQAASDRSFPGLISPTNLLGEYGLQFTYRDLLIVGVTVPIMIALTYFVKYTRLGKAMRAAAQNPTAAKLMGIDVDRVISATFVIGGGLAGVASVIYSLTITRIGYTVGFQNGLYAFTAAVLGGIGNIPGAVLGGLLIGLVRSLGDGYVGTAWSSALVFLILIVILIFRPSGFLGAHTREKV